MAEDTPTEAVPPAAPTAEQEEAAAAAAAAPEGAAAEGAAAEGAAAEGAAGAGDEDTCTAVFEPLTQLDEVEVKTMEEDEDVLYTQRARLFVWRESLLDQGTGEKSWLDRGIGNVKLLKHREHGKIRVLMRQERTLKIIINHLVHPDTVLEPNAGNDRSWVWTASDFADEELKDEVFAIRFKDSDIANAFKDAYDSAKGEMAAQAAAEGAAAGGEEAKADDGAADAAADALAGLSVEEGAQ